ncbi:flagellar filament capping protein FliD [Nocardioides panacisoli]|uniref:Flagellar hook-associated protein 2 n=1 Tax=Nocardioides panacisoli TaxID=627624 RepID=A0ABP7HSA4_9ACTN
MTTTSSTASISGLVSGLDTAGLIDKMMQLEATTQNKLKIRVTSEQSEVTALQALNTKLANLSTTAAGLSGASSSTTNVWATLQATSSNSAVTVTATSSAAPTAFSVTVGQTALSHQLAFLDPHAKTDVVTGTGTDVVLKRSGQPDLTISTAGGTLDQVASAINAANAGVRATLVKVGTSGGTDQYRLLVESTTTGAGQAFDLTDADGGSLLGGATVRAGRDATISVGGIDATSSTNTFADLVPGVTITLGAAATGTAAISVSRDATARSAAVKTMVTSINAILDSISTQTANNSDASKAGVLAGDGTVRQVASNLLESIYPGDKTSMAAYGIQVDRYGKLVFDETKFAAAYQADPDAVTAAITGTNGFAARVKKVADAASDRYTGSVTTTINGHNSTIKQLNDSIASWDDRLALRRTTLETQYTALETALSQMQSQQAWLTSQLSALSSSSSS